MLFLFRVTTRQFQLTLTVLALIAIIGMASYSTAQQTNQADKTRLKRQASLFTRSQESLERGERQSLLFTKPPPVPKANPPVAIQSSPGPAVTSPAAPTLPAAVVFIVPGTYGNSGFWPKVIPGKATFASELKAASGPGTRIEDFVWKSSIHHNVRVTAGTNLAHEINEKTRPTDRIVLIGHSHGGNVALLAAAACSRRIDMVVCISTPHVYQQMKGDKKEYYDLPVYCPPQSREKIGTIITLTPVTDEVPTFYASLRKGIDANVALHATRHWRDKIGNLAIVDDGSPLRELVSDVVGSGHSNVLPVRSSLNIANYNIRFSSQVASNMGDGPHRTVHSRRMGAVIGGLVKTGATIPQRRYLWTLTQLSWEDGGEPVDDAVQQEWISNCSPFFRQASGWRLTSVEITVTDTGDQANLFGTNPDPFFKIFSEERVKGKINHAVLIGAPVRRNEVVAKWTSAARPGELQADTVIWHARTLFAVYEMDFSSFRQLGKDQPLIRGPTGFSRVLSGKDWSAKLTWTPVHL